MTRARCAYCVPRCQECGVYYAVQSLADACYERHQEEAARYADPTEE